MKSTVFAIAMLTAIGATERSSAQEAGIYGVEALPLAVDYGPGMYAHPTMEGVDKYQNGTYLEFSDIIEAYSERISKQLERLLGDRLAPDLNQHSITQVPPRGEPAQAD